MAYNAQLHVDPTTIRDPSMAPYIAASTIGKVTGSEYDDADEVLSTDTTEALREAAKKRADTYDEEDPQSNKAPVAPMGILAIHLLNMKNFDHNATDVDLSNRNIRFKILVSIGDIFKETGMKQGTHKYVRDKDRLTSVLMGVAVDEVKNFSLTVPQQLSDLNNILRLELYSTLVTDDPSTEPRLVGMVEVHLHEIIQAMMVIDVLPLSLNHKQVANLYLEFAFMYGALGFHYSTQLENPGFNPNRDLCRTMFPRVALPEDRDGEVLMPTPQHPPSFVPWTCPVITHWDETVRHAPEGPPPTAPSGFSGRVRSEIRRILADYVPLRSRGDRLAFLRRLVRGSPGPAHNEDTENNGGDEEDNGPPLGPSDHPSDRRRPDPNHRRTAPSGSGSFPDRDGHAPSAAPTDQTAQLRQSGGSSTTPMPALVRTAADSGPESAGRPSPREAPHSSSSSSSPQQQQQLVNSSPSRSTDVALPSRGPQRSASSAAKIAAPKLIRRAPLRRPTGDSSSSVIKTEETGTGGTADESVDVP